MSLSRFAVVTLVVTSRAGPVYALLIALPRSSRKDIEDSAESTFSFIFVLLPDRAGRKM